MAKDYTNLTEKQWSKIDPPLKPPRNVEVQEMLMRSVHEILNGFNIDHWLGGGELLCIYRDNRLLAHNQDIDFIVRSEEFAPLCNKIKSMCLKYGFDTRAFKNNTRLSLMWKEEMASIEGYSLKGKYRWLKNRRVPARYFEAEGLIAFNGQVYRCPSPVEKYLSWRYSNWKKEYSGNSKYRHKYINKRKLMGHK